MVERGGRMKGGRLAGDNLLAGELGERRHAGQMSVGSHSGGGGHLTRSWGPVVVLVLILQSRVMLERGNRSGRLLLAVNRLLLVLLSRRASCSLMMLTVLVRGGRSRLAPDELLLLLLLAVRASRCRVETLVLARWVVCGHSF